jgi:peptidoglycan/xylan/chitin deacetylase (PgdA/CDA1 family)
MVFSAGGATNRKRKIRKNAMASKYSSSFDEMLNENREQMRELTGEKKEPVQPSTQSTPQSPSNSSKIAASQVTGSAKGIPFSVELPGDSRPNHRNDRTGGTPAGGNVQPEPTRPHRSHKAAEPSPDAAQLAQKSHKIGKSSGKKEIFCAIGVDVDAVAGWLGSYGGEDSPCDISRGLFSGEVGIPRMLKLFDKLDIKTTWFIPGHSIETFPEQCKMVVDGGHEVGMHGYSHENPIAMTPVQEEAVMDKCIDLIEDLCGRRPTGYVAPWWEFSPVTNELLLKKGIKYDHSLMNDDFHPFYVRVGDSWTKIDYSKHPDEWMKPLVRGIETDLVDIPGSWYLDDLPPMMFIKSAPNSHGFVNPRDIGELWRDQFDWVYREFDYAVYTLTIHPDVSGRPQVLMMLEKLLQYIQSHEGIKFCTFDEIADDFIQRNPRKKQ